MGIKWSFKERYLENYKLVDAVLEEVQKKICNSFAENPNTEITLEPKPEKESDPQVSQAELLTLEDEYSNEKENKFDEISNLRNDASSEDENINNHLKDEIAIRQEEEEEYMAILKDIEERSLFSDLYANPPEIIAITEDPYNTKLEKKPLISNKDLSDNIVPLHSQLIKIIVMDGKIIEESYKASDGTIHCIKGLSKEL
ncbi:hypothetical protein [Prochlorococcus sp. MIT 1300]|uniref:hypothetical protein n=1 Tax=Prochlorococcus sp. MIT 1300 TaxID=3096218 RepID=UPI002A7518CB|nr:hypothetical protein [Prochlorococcus sp. MIT 1300]